MGRWMAVAMTVAAAVGLGYVHPFGNPRAEPAKGLNRLLDGAKMPADAKRVLVTKCADCHSNETRWPFYSRIAPGSWLMEWDIVEARRKLDLSRWLEMPAETQEVWTAKILSQAKSGGMPPLQYRFLHWGARLSTVDIQTLSMLSNRASEGDDPLTEEGNPARGKAVFQRRCTGCHAMEDNREGPRLAGVYGRRAGSIAGFTYSAGLKNSGITWNETTLEEWLTDPDVMVPDNQMSFSVPNAEDRRDLVDYLKQESPE